MSDPIPKGRSKFSLEPNLRLLWELLCAFPRTTATIFALVIGSNVIVLGLISLAVMPAYSNGWRPSAWDIILHVLAIVPWLVVLKLWIMLASYRGRTGHNYPGSFLIASVFLSALFIATLPAVFWGLTQSGGFEYELGGILVLASIGFPLAAIFFWISILSSGYSKETWPVWLPRE